MNSMHSFSVNSYLIYYYAIYAFQNSVSNPSEVNQKRETFTSFVACCSFAHYNNVLSVIIT